MREALDSVGLTDIQTRAITVPAAFPDFQDYWERFRAGEAPAQRFLAALDVDSREQLRIHLRRMLPRNADDAIPLTLKARAVRGTRDG